MIKAWKSFSIFAVLALMFLLAPVVILVPAENVAQGKPQENVTQEVEASFSFTEDSDGEWHNFTAGSAGIDAEGLYLAQFTRAGVNRSVLLPGCQFRNYTTGSGTVSDDLNGTMWVSWLTFKFNQIYPYTPKYNETFTATDFGWMAGRGHFYDGTNPNDNFTFVFILDFDSDDNMSAAAGKGFMLSVNETGTFAGHKIIGDFDISKGGLNYTGNFHLRNYDPSEVFDLGNLDATGPIMWEPTDDIHSGLDLLDFTSDGPQSTPTDVPTAFEEIAWGKEPLKNVTSAHLGVNGTMDLSRNTALYLEVNAYENWVHVQGTTACNLYIDDTDTGVRKGDGSPYGELYELLLLYSPYQELPMGGFSEWNGSTFIPFGLPNSSTECYAGTESFGLVNITLQLLSPWGSGVYPTRYWYGLYPHPNITSISPSSGYVGETLDVTISGKYLLRADDYDTNTGSVSLGPNITVNSYWFKNNSPLDNEIIARITINPGAGTMEEDVNVTSCFGYSGGQGAGPYLSDELNGFTVKALEGSTIEGTLAFPARVGSEIEPFTVKVFEAGNLSNLIWSGSTLTGSSGVYIISNLTAGSYDIGIKNCTCLSELNTSVTLASKSVVDFGTIREGDADNNDYVVMADLGCMLPAWNKQVGDPEYSVKYDFNRDGYVTMADLGVMLPNWNQKGDLAP